MSGLILVDLSLIDDDPANPRGDVGDVSDLKQSLKHRGQQDPIHVIAKGDGRYLLFEGHRRRKALTELGRTHAKAVERTFKSDLDRLLAQGAIHAHRKDFGPMAWSRYLYRLFWEHKMTREEIAAQLGVSQGWVRDTLSFVRLHPTEQAALEAGVLTRREALRRLAERRAVKSGKPAPQPPAGTERPPAQRVPAGEPYLNGGHRLAEQVAARCASGGTQHVASPKIGGTGCGLCWEHVIRADALTAARPALVAA